MPTLPGCLGVRNCRSFSKTGRHFIKAHINRVNSGNFVTIRINAIRLRIMKIQSRLICASFLLAAAVHSTHAATITVSGSALKGGELLAGVFTEATTGTAAGINNSPPSEPASAAIDADNGSKYLNFAREDTGYIVIPAVGPAIVTGINFVTGNDAPNRDPASYILFGSNSVSSLAASIFSIAGNGFTQISAGALSLPNTGTNLTGNLAQSEGRGYAASVIFTNSTAYTSYILTFPTLRGAENSMQIAGAVLTGTVIPEPATGVFAGLALVGMFGLRRRAKA